MAARSAWRTRRAGVVNVVHLHALHRPVSVHHAEGQERARPAGEGRPDKAVFVAVTTDPGRYAKRDRRRLQHGGRIGRRLVFCDGTSRCRKECLVQLRRGRRHREEALRRAAREGRLPWDKRSPHRASLPPRFDWRTRSWTPSEAVTTSPTPRRSGSSTGRAG